MRHIRRGPPIPHLLHRYEGGSARHRKKPSFDSIGRNHAIVGEALPSQSVCLTSSFRVWRIYVTLGGAGCDFDGKQ